MKSKKGSALLLTLFLVSGIMVVAFAGSYIIISGLRSSGLQYDSTRAYFAAEAGAEYSLMMTRQKGYDLGTTLKDNIFSGDLPGTNPGKFIVDYVEWNPIRLKSIGTYGVTKRSVELKF